MTGSWGVVVPVKRLELAKTRLAAHGDDVRRQLALAFAADVVVAAVQVAQVLVVTDDAVASTALEALGAVVTPDDPDAGLNPALTHGAELLRRRAADLGVATVSADLPALRPDDLRHALSLVSAGERGFVADHSGTGTTLLAAGPGAALGPSYGASSRAAHAASGARELVGAPGLRRDVDTPQDLLTALALGVGRHTAAVAKELGLQVLPATVRGWGPEAGSAFLDDGTVVELRSDALQDSVFRFVRAGQRVRLVLDGKVGVRLSLP